MACGIMHSSIRLLIGDPIPDVAKVLTRYESLCKTYSQFKVAYIARGALQTIRNLQGNASNPLVLTGEYMDEDKVIQELQKGDIRIMLTPILHFKLMVAVLLNENQAAHDLYQRLHANFKGFIFPFIPIYQKLYRGLVATALARESTGWARRKHLAEARNVLNTLKKRLPNCPDNISPKIALIEAELEFCSGRFSAALLKYDVAISSSQLQGFVSDQAIASEKAGRMLMQAGRHSEARSYLQNARLHYKSWGLQIKVDELDRFLHSVSKADQTEATRVSQNSIQNLQALAS